MIIFNFLLNILIIVVIIGVLVLVHELGHFIAARLSGMYVIEFSLGMGPLIWKKKKGETQYSIRLLPIGGYVNILGEEVDETGNQISEQGKNENKKNKSDKKECLPDPKSDPRSFKNKPWLSRFFVLIAGVSMNIILTIALYQIVMLFAGFRFFVVDSLAEMNPWFGSMDCNTFEGVCVIQYQGIGKVFSGLTHLLNNLQFMGYYIPKFISDALSQGDYQSIAAGSVSSPVGMYFVVDELKKGGLLNLLDITALMSLSLAIINLLPIPALDGGRVFLLLIEGVIGKPLNPKIEAILIKYSFYALLIFMVLVLLKDIIFIDLIKNMVG